MNLPTNSMNVFINTSVLDTRQIVVDDVHDITNVKATSGDGGCDQDRTLASAESSTADFRCVVVIFRWNDLQCVLSLALRTIRMN